jgi:hypothetical protein
MTRKSKVGGKEGIERALSLVTEALDVLDAHEGSAEAAALLELARQELKDSLSRVAL